MSFDDNDLRLYKDLINALSALLNGKDRLGIQNLPGEFNGITSDMLYDEGVENAALVLLVDSIIQLLAGKSDDEIIAQFELLRTALITVYERAKSISE